MTESVKIALRTEVTRPGEESEVSLQVTPGEQIGRAHV